MELWVFVQYNVGDVHVSNSGVLSENREIISEMLQSCIREHGMNFRTKGVWM